MSEKIRMLLENKWERYDEKKMRRMKILIGIFAFLFIYIMLFIMVYSFSHNYITSALWAAGLLPIVVLIFYLKLRQMDQKKDGWYFSGLQDERLKREDILELIRKFLDSKGYVFHEEETHRTATLWITYFTLPTTDFKLRLWFSKLGGVPTAEVGIGPESPVNKELLEELRKEISEEFVKRYGMRKIEGEN